VGQLAARAPSEWQRKDLSGDIDVTGPSAENRHSASGIAEKRHEPRAQGGAEEQARAAAEARRSAVLSAGTGGAAHTPRSRVGAAP
jgi:hypothetical protein